MAQWSRDGRCPVALAISRHFGSWATAWETNGVPYPRPPGVMRRRMVTRAHHLAALQAVGPYCTVQAWDARYDPPTSGAIRAAFGSWPAAWTAVGIPAPAPAALKLARTYPTGCSSTAWDAAGHRPRSATLIRIYGSWASFCAAAGVPYGRYAIRGPLPVGAPARELSARDAAIWTTRQQGARLQEIADAHEITPERVRQILARAQAPSA